MKVLFSNTTGLAEVRENEPLASHTTFQIGGPCDLMVFPETPEAFAEVLRVCRTNDIDALVLGKGSNMLVSDKTPAASRCRRLQRYGVCGPVADQRQQSDR